MIIFAWWGFPQYAARCVGALVKSTTEKVIVVATRPEVPVEGMERVCGCPVYWIDGDGSFDLRLFDCLIGTDAKRITLFVSGWAIPAFNRLAADVRAKDGRVIAMIDNNFDAHGVRGWLREFGRAVRFRLFLRKRFDGFFVPGRSGRKLLRFYGVSDKKIVEGMYAADESLFDSNKVDAAKKEKLIVYVGQYIDRKNVLAVCEAFERSGIAADGWSLEMYGSGPLKAQIPYAQPFVQPERLPEIYRRARAFILASKEEHWGLVVHEAALSGCYLMLSNRVGAAEDLLSEKNGVKFDPFQSKEMVAAFRRLAEMNEKEWEEVCLASMEMGRRRGLRCFWEGIFKF